MPVSITIRRAPRRHRLASAAATCGIAVAAVAAAGCGTVGTGNPVAAPSAHTAAQSASPQASAAPVIPPLAAGQQGSQRQVPWAQVGPGWILAEWSPSSNGSAGTSLFLIDPAGGRYLIDTFPADPTASAPTFLADWSGDGQRALLTNSGASLTAAVLNLRTLTITRFQLPNAFALGFTRPDGEGILVSVNPSGARQTKLERVSLTGQLELSYPASFSQGNVTTGSALYSRAGTVLAVGTCHVVIASAPCAPALAGIELMTNAGQALRFLPISPSIEGCTPLRWWTTDELLASCIPASSSATQLWLVPTSGAKPTALTANPPAAGDLGDLDAWRLPSGTYVEDAGACGYVYVAKLQPSGQTAPVAVPGVPSGDTAIIRGAQGDRLAIDAHPPCGQGATLLWFAPATNSVTAVLGGTVNGGTAENAILFGEP